MIRGKCALGRGSEGFPVFSMPLSKLIYPSAFTERQELSMCHCFVLQMGIYFVESPQPPSRSNPAD